MQASDDRPAKLIHLARLLLIGICIVVASSIGTRISAQQNTPPLSVDDIVKMAKANLAEDIIISQLRKNGKAFALSPDQMITLKTAGISDNVIRVMLDPRTATIV